MTVYLLRDDATGASFIKLSIETKSPRYNWFHESTGGSGGIGRSFTTIKSAEEALNARYLELREQGYERLVVAPS